MDGSWVFLLALAWALWLFHIKTSDCHLQIHWATLLTTLGHVPAAGWPPQKHFLLWGFFSPLLIVKMVTLASPNPTMQKHLLWLLKILFIKIKLHHFPFPFPFQPLSYRHFTPSQTGSPLLFYYYCERYINVSIFKQTYWVYLSFLGIYHSRADHIVLDSPLRGSCLRKTNSASQ